MTTTKPRFKPATLADLEALPPDVADWWPPAGLVENDDES